MPPVRDNPPLLNADTPTADAVLVAAARGGCLESFSALVWRYQGNIRAFLVIRLDKPHEAEDLAQEVFITAFQKLPTYDTMLPLGPWLRGIAFNLLRNYRKKSRPLAVGGEVELAALIDSNLSGRYSPARESAVFAALEECLEKLDPGARKLLHRRYHDDAGVGDIARESGRNHSTVTMQLHRLRAALAECIRNRTEDSL